MSPNGDNALRRTSSLVLGLPTKSSTPGRRSGKVAVEVVPDSEEGNEKKTRGKALEGEIIELSSDSDDDIEPFRSTTQNKTTFIDPQSDLFLGSPRKLVSSPSKLSKTIVQESDSDEESDVQPHYTPKVNKMPRARRTVISDSEDELDTEGSIDITKGEDAQLVDSNSDGAILVFDDPPSSRKPAARDDVSLSKPERPHVFPLVHSTSSEGQVIIEDPSPVQTPVLARPRGTPGTQAKLSDFFALGGKSPEKGGARDNIEADIIASTPVATTTPVTPARVRPLAKRKTKKALQQEKQAHLAAYAQALFDELNVSVFKSRLPKETPLMWNNRLLATAGRARWHKDGQGVQTTCIELATKVLDCEERIRNTLSHEMCHLACWVINCNPKENHGRVWQGWVDEVMDKRPDIAISTKHSYDISYKYEWQCQTATCKKISYGRHSNSIDPAKSICGVCKVGDLAPLFQTRARKTKATSKMAADKTLDSPVLSARRPTGTGVPGPTRLKNIQQDGTTIVTLDSSSEREAVSGADTDIDDYIAVVEPKISQVTVKFRSSDVDGSHEKGKADTKGGAHVEDVRKLVTHLSIIDLTDE